MVADAGMWLPWGSHYAGIQDNSLEWMYKVFLALFYGTNRFFNKRYFFFLQFVFVI